MRYNKHRDCNSYFFLFPSFPFCRVLFLVTSFIFISSLFDHVKFCHLLLYICIIFCNVDSFAHELMRRVVRILFDEGIVTLAVTGKSDKNCPEPDALLLPYSVRLFVPASDQLHIHQAY